MYDKIQATLSIALVLSLIIDVYFNYKDVAMKERLIKSNESLKTLLEQFFKIME